ncbi:MAG TPA: bi-domain-containing oxidoreductase [Phycisphaerae bacterium]|nr:bi-domain-containing oxidoreductase [Phycisphaerae bacterium]
MKQVLQNLKTGVVELAEIPAPLVRPGHLLIQTSASLISPGTERMLVEFAKGTLLAKARSQPERVRQVLDKIKTDGLLPTMEAVFSRLDEPQPMGMSNAGVVLDVGAGVIGFKPGDRVANNGLHAEIVCIPQNLCAVLPDHVPDDHGAFVVLGAIGLQGIRLLNPTLGETVAVIGLGMIGLLTVQLLQAHGCTVIGIDTDARRLGIARKFGARIVDLPGGADAVAQAKALSKGRGVDGVIITASSKSNDIIRQAAKMSRQRGRIVLVGVVGMELARTDFYRKELSFQVSCSYGPGRYDPQYEEKGQDYPLPFVRWTSQRNFEAVIDMMAAGRLDVSPLISKKLPFAGAAEAYGILTEDRESLGIVLEYPRSAPSDARIVLVSRHPAEVTAAAGGMAVIGLVGAGNFAKATLLPALKGLPVRLRTVASAGGVSSTHLARKFGFEQATTDYRAVLNDPSINLAMIVTRHDLHARMTAEFLAAGKHVMVEKPLCITAGELASIRAALGHANGRQLLVGTNRRFSPHTEKMKSLLAGRSEPMTMVATINAGVIPADSWTQDPTVGGGRIIGEGCHWVDMMRHLVGAPITQVTAVRVGESPGLTMRDDKMTITLSFADGSVGTLHYFGNGHRSYPKETVEVFCDGKVLRLDNFRVLTGYGWKGFRKFKTRRQDKGHAEQFRRLTEAVAKGGPALMPFDEIENVMRATFASVESAHRGCAVDLA